jgi:DNA polymerase-3 subunit gamma/tau
MVFIKEIGMKKSLSLYRKYRPQNFGELLGQPGAVRIIQRALREDRVSHAYLFSGPRGCGKTSMARIFAKALNCQNLLEGPEPCGICSSCESIRLGDNLDVVEIDAASNRGIDEIRELKEQVALAPYGERWKIYIIDEVHMLTEHAFNALLKTLEEPPEYALFILATTEPHKVPVTIRSRCQHLPFHRIPGEIMIPLLEEVARGEGVEPSSEALWEIARSGDGALRDALSLLEQALVMEEKNLTLQGVQRLLGGSGRKEIEDLVTLLRESPGDAYGRFHELLGRGGSVIRLYEGMFRLFGDLWTVGKWGEGVLQSLDLSEKEKGYLALEAPLWDLKKLWRGMDFLSHWLPRLRMGIDGELLGALLWGELTEVSPSLSQEAGETRRDAAPPGDFRKEVPSSSREPSRNRSAASHGDISSRLRELGEALPGEEKMLLSEVPDVPEIPKAPQRDIQQRVIPKEDAPKPSFSVSPPSVREDPFPPEEAGESPSSMDPSWEKFLRHLYPRAPWLSAALLDVAPRTGSDSGIYLDFSSQKGNHRFVLLASSQGEEMLAPSFRECYGDIPLILLRGERRETLFSPGGKERPSPERSPKREEPPEPSKLSTLSKPATPSEEFSESLFEEFPFFEELSRERTSSGKSGIPEGAEKASEAASEDALEEDSFVGTLLSFVGGEILLEKREGAEPVMLDEMEGDLPEHEE